MRATHPTDAELMQRVREDRDHRAIEALYARHNQLAMSCALRVVFDRGLAADAVQGAFLDVWRNSHGYEPKRGSVSGWITAVTVNRSIDILRRSRTQERVEHAVVAAAHVEPERESSAQAVIDRDRAGRWRAGVNTLPTTQREVIEMAYYDDLTQTEIASRLGIPLGTVKGRVRLGLARLRHLATSDPAEYAER